jgi:hypothetical protein
MLVSLFITSTILVQRFSLMGHRHRPHHVLAKAVLVLGSLMLLLTAIFPQRYDADGTLLSPRLEVRAHRARMEGVCIGRGVRGGGWSFWR